MAKHRSPRPRAASRPVPQCLFGLLRPLSPPAASTYPKHQRLPPAKGDTQQCRRSALPDCGALPRNSRLGVPLSDPFRVGHVNPPSGARAHAAPCASSRSRRHQAGPRPGRVTRLPRPNRSPPRRPPRPPRPACCPRP
eukprot:4320608-Prymnesium_polylepis.1